MIDALAAGDTADAVALWAVCELTRPWNDPAADIALALGGPQSTILAARDGGRMVGTVMAGVDGHRGWVYHLAVAPDMRGSGLGRALMAAAEAWIAARGVVRLNLMVRTGNDAVLGLRPPRLPARRRRGAAARPRVTPPFAAARVDP